MAGWRFALVLLLVDLVLALPARGGSTGFVHSGLPLSPSLPSALLGACTPPLARAQIPPSGRAASPLARPVALHAGPRETGPSVREPSLRRLEPLPLPSLLNKPLLSQRDSMPSGGGGRGGLKEKEEEKKLEFAVERGKAIDTLLHDMPYIFDSTPDFSIYRDDICLRDSAGFSASGKTPYRMFFSALRTVVPLIFHKAIVSVHIMNKYDDDQGRIRLRWKVELFREDDGDQETVEERRKREALQRLGFEVPCSGHHAPEEDKGDKLVEGISVYHLDEAGRIYRHTIESTEPTSMAEAYAKLGLIGATPASVGGRDYDMSLSGRDFDAMRGDGELEA